MGTYTIINKYDTQEKCIEYLESIRYKYGVFCPHCGVVDHYSKRKDTNIYHCISCNEDFTVLIGTIFEHSRLPLPKWFFIIMLMLEARKGISSSQLARNAEVTYKTAWLTAMRVRCAMIEDIELSGTVEGDETYIGGNPKKVYKRDNSLPQLSQVSQDPEPLEISNSKRGRGTSKAKIAGMVERKGRIVLRLMDTFSTVTMLAMLKRNVDTTKSTVMTDEAKFYNKFEDYVDHFVIKHKDTYVNGKIHTNTIEGFWSIVKAGIKGQYKVLSKKYLPFYLAEFAYRYNRRNQHKLLFDDYIETALSETKTMLYYKPLEVPREKTNKLTTQQKKLAERNEFNMEGRVLRLQKLEYVKKVYKKRTKKNKNNKKKVA